MLSRFRILLIILLAPSTIMAQNTPPPASQPVAPKNPPRRLYVLAEGQVFDGMGMGIEGAAITANLKKPDGSHELLNTATTNDAGDFKILHTNPNPGTVLVEIKKWGYATCNQEFIPTTEGLPPYLAVELKGAIIVFGRVIDETDETPIPGADVTIETAYTYLDTKTDQNGRFQLKGLLPGNGTIGVSSKGFGNVNHPVDNLEEFAEIVIKMQKGRRIVLNIKCEKDRPIAGSWYQALIPEPYDFREGQVDENNQIILEGVHAAANELNVQIEHPDYLMITEVTDLETGVYEIEDTIELFRAARLVGKVLSPDGKPVNGAKVIVGEGTDDSRPADWADFDGSFEISGIYPGVHPVTVHLSGYSPIMRDISFYPGQRRSDEWFTLEKEKTVEGSVVTPDGKPIPNAMIVCTGWREHFTLRIGAFSDKDGKFVIRSAPPDSFSLRVSTRDGKATTTLDVQGGDTDVVITLDTETEKSTNLAKNTKAPDFEITTLKDRKFSLSDLKGKWILLDFWATWCTPCRLDIPYIKDAQKQFGSENFIVISISLDDDEKALRAFIVEEAMTWHQVFGEKGGANKMTSDYKVSGIPHTVLIDPDGNIARQNMRGVWLDRLVRESMENYSRKQTTTQPSPATQPAPTTQKALEPEKENLPDEELPSNGRNQGL